MEQKFKQIQKRKTGHYKREKSTTTKNHYLTNKELLAEVLKCKKEKKISERLLNLFILLVERNIRSWKIPKNASTLKDDYINFALETLIIKVPNFNELKSDNPFSYFTTITRNAFKQFQDGEKKQYFIIEELKKNSGHRFCYFVEDVDYDKIDTVHNEAFEETNNYDLAEVDDDGLYDLAELEYRFVDKPRASSECVTYSGSEVVYDESLGYYVKKQI